MFDEQNIQFITLIGAAVLSLPPTHGLKMALIYVVINTCMAIYIIGHITVHALLAASGLLLIAIFSIAWGLLTVLVLFLLYARIWISLAVQRGYLQPYLPYFWAFTALSVILTCIWLRCRTTQRTVLVVPVGPFPPRRELDRDG